MVHCLDGGAGGRRTDQFGPERGGGGGGGGGGGRGGLCAGRVKQVAVGPHYLQVGRAPSTRGQTMAVLMLLLLLPLSLSLLLVPLLGRSRPQRDGGRRPVGSRPDMSFLLGPSVSLPICVGRKRAWGEGRRRRRFHIVEIAWRRKPSGRCGLERGGGGGGGGVSEEVFVVVDAHFSPMRHGGPTCRSSAGCWMHSAAFL